MNLRTGLVLASLGMVACGQDQRKIEADRVLRRVDTLIAADRQAKEGPLSALEAEPCNDDVVCAAKRDCEAAFRPMVESQRLSNEVRADLAAGKDPQDMKRKIDAADAANQEATSKMDACLRSSESARSKYHL